MKNFRLLFFILILAIISVVVHSCTKESNTSPEKQTSLSDESLLVRLQNTGLDVISLKKPDSIVGVGCMPILSPGCITIHVTDTISVPANGLSPGCATTQVQYDATICGPLSSPTIHITNFQAFPLGCPSLWSYWFSLSSGNLSLAEEKFFYDASLIAEQLFMEEVVDIFEVRCPNRAMESVFTRDLCYQKCLVKIKTWPFFAFETSHCGTKCCHRTRLFCRNQSGVLLYTEPTFQETGDECSFNPTILCDGLSTVCEHNCGPK